MVNNDTKARDIRSELLSIIEDVLGETLPPIPDDTPLLDFILSSLALVEGMRRLYEHFGVLVSIRRVVEGQVTLGGLAAYIEQELQQKGQEIAARLESVQQTTGADVRRIPLAPSQQHAGFLFRYASNASAAFNEAIAVQLAGQVDGVALQSSIETVAARYEALRTSYHPDVDVLIVTSEPSLKLTLSTADIADIPDRLSEAVSRPFGYDEPLFRAELIRADKDLHFLIVVTHALVMDQEALRLVLEEIATGYSAFTRNQELGDLFPALQWTDYLAMGEADLWKEVRSEAEKYWLSQFEDGGPAFELPSDFPRPAIKQYSGSSRSIDLSPALTGRVRARSTEMQMDFEVLIFSVFSLYLARLTSQEELIIGVRSSPLFLDSEQRVVGQTRNMLPVRLSIDFGSAFQTFAHIVRNRVAEADLNRNYSFAELIRTLDIPRDQSRSPLYTAAFSYQNPGLPPNFLGLSSREHVIPGSNAKYDLELTVLEIGDDVRLGCTYSDELFLEETIDRWLDGLLEMLRQAASAPETICGLLPVMQPDEKQRLIHEINDTEAPLPAGRTVLDLIVKQAEKTPEAVAIRFEESSMSYVSLLRRVRSVAVKLLNAGVGHADRVGILLERSPDMVAALLGVWWVGAQYVPLDLAFPAQRLEYMLEDSGVVKLITRKQHVREIQQIPPEKLLYLSGSPDESTDNQAAEPVARPDDAAYIIYTSGSTGQPKGVQIKQASLLNTMLSVQDHLALGSSDRFLAVTTISFDISTTEVFLPLMTGGTVDIVPDGVIADGQRLASMLRTHKPTIMQATPSTWKSILAAGWQGDGDLVICSAGEALPRSLVEMLLARCRSVWNLYGPTETTVYSTVGAIHSSAAEEVTIGFPLRNTQVYILDERLQPVPFGAVGELYIGGAGLAIGYWQRPALTRERFLPDPFRAGGAMYRTGDLARYRSNGDLLCLGRIDQQVKIHGVRVELGEIETHLRTVPGISDAVVTAWQDSQGSYQLVAHLTADSHPPPATGDIRSRLREALPEVMVPPYMVFHESFPLTENGKIKRSALPGPDIDQQAKKDSGPPETAVEKSLADAWSRILNIERTIIGRDADFMDLGGHSLLIAPLLLEVRRLFRVSFSMREFFGASTLRALAKLVEDRLESNSGKTNGAQAFGPVRNESWGRQRMDFLAREAELPPSLGPARGVVFKPVDRIRKLFMTGATGFLGAYLIDGILRETEADLYCLVRPKRGMDERSRIEHQMRHYHVWREEETWQKAWQDRVHIVSGDVTLPRLGINDGLYDELAEDIDAILHSAAHVNFIYPYESLRGTNVGGVHEIIRFAFFNRIKPVHHISTAAIWPMGSQYTFYEKDPIQHGQVLNLGYDEAKWVAEMSLIHAGERGLPVVRYRPGEVGGDSSSGRCVTDHFLIASIKGFLQFGAFPELDIEVDVAPVDYVAKAIVYILFNKKPYGRAFHLTNPERIHMSRALDFLRDLGYRFVTLPFETLRDRLINSPDFSENALFAYQAMLQEFDDVSLQLPTYDTRETRRVLKDTAITCHPADEKLFGTYLKYLQDINFIPVAEAFQV